MFGLNEYGGDKKGDIIQDMIDVNKIFNIMKDVNEQVFKDLQKNQITEDRYIEVIKQNKIIMNKIKNKKKIRFDKYEKIIRDAKKQIKKSKRKQKRTTKRYKKVKKKIEKQLEEPITSEVITIEEKPREEDDPIELEEEEELDKIIEDIKAGKDKKDAMRRIKKIIKKNVKKGISARISKKRIINYFTKKRYPLLEKEIRKIPDDIKYDRGMKPLYVKEDGKGDIIDLQSHQKKFLEGFIFGNLRSAIVFHGTGTGKTLTAVATSRLYLQMYPNNKVIVITPSAVLYNFIDALLEYGIDGRDKRYSFWTYEKFRRSKEKDVKNSLVIVDEAHNYRSPISAKIVTNEEGEQVVEYKPQNKKGQDLLEQSFKLDKVLLLTATPFINNNYDIENLLAIGDGRYPLDIDIYHKIIHDDDRMKDYFRYRISRHEMTKGSKNFPRRVDKLFTVVVPDTYKKIRADTLMENDKKKKNSFYIHSRQSGLDYDNKKFDYITKTMKNKKNKGKKFVVYTTFLNAGVNAFVKQLIKSDITYAILSGKQTTKKKDVAKKLYNNSSIDGEDGVQCLIITMAGREGVDLKNTRAIFLLDFLWNDATTHQIIARAIRYKSHEALPVKDRYVEVYKMFVCYKHEANLLKKAYGKSIERQYAILSAKIEGSSRSTEYTMYKMQIRKRIEIDDIIEKLEKVKKVEDSIAHLKENHEIKKMYDKLLTNKITYKAFLKFINSKLTPLLGKSINLYDYVKDKAIGSLEKLMGNKGQPLTITFKEKAKMLQQYFTPKKIVDKIIKKSGIRNEDKTKTLRILEPSAGRGSFVKGLIEVKKKKGINIDIDIVEFDKINRGILQAYIDVDPLLKDIMHLQNEKDFLKFFGGDSSSYDYIFMNPPFHLRKGNFKVLKRDVVDVDFIKRAYAMLKDDGGKLYCIMGDGGSSKKKVNTWLTGLKKKKHEITYTYKKIKDKWVEGEIEYSTQIEKQSSNLALLTIHKHYNGDNLQVAEELNSLLLKENKTYLKSSYL